MFKKIQSLTQVCLALLLSVASTNLLSATASAYSLTNPNGDFKKVYVCKYVGTPGVNETLQSGNNPISVSTNALANFTGLGSFFKDGQNNSIAIAWDNGDNVEPPVSMCPAAPGPATIPVPTVPVNDPCGPGNAVYGTVPSGDYTYVLNQDGSITFTANAGFVFTGGLASVTLPAPVDSNVACPVVPATIPVPTVPVNDPCGPGNAVYGTVPSGDYTYVLNQDGSITFTANAGFVFTGGLAVVNLPTPVDTNVACPVDVCPNIGGLQLTIPQGMMIDNAGNCVDKKIEICHATSAVVNPYNKISVSTNAADGIAGNSGGQADHFGEHTGPIFDPLTNINGDDWGDIIPPITGIHNGLNWTTQGQAIYNNGDCVYVPPTDSCPLVPGLQTNTTLCPPGQGGGGHVLSDTATTTPRTVLPNTLPATGSETGPLALILAMVTAYGAVYFLQGRRNLATSSEK